MQGKGTGEYLCGLLSFWPLVLLLVRWVLIQVRKDGDVFKRAFFVLFFYLYLKCGYEINRLFCCIGCSFFVFV